MKGCPRCESVSAWLLGDGRLKCQSCGRRYRWRSVWDSIRLSDAAKETMLDAFVRGLPAAQCAAEQACADSREKFYRLVRACCVKHERAARDGLCAIDCSASWSRARPAMRGWAGTRSVMMIGIAQHLGVMQIAAPAIGFENLLPRLRERAAVGGILQLDRLQAGACLPMQGEYVIVPKTTRAAPVINATEAFWHHTRVQLQGFRKIPSKFFALYLAEACLRFNHRDQDLQALLRELMDSTAIDELRPLLLAAPVRIGRGDGDFSSATCVASRLATS